MLVEESEGNGTLGMGGDCFALLLEAALLRERGRCLLIKSISCRSSTELLPLDDEGSAGVLLRVSGRPMDSVSRRTESSSLASVMSERGRRKH